MPFNMSGEKAEEGEKPARKTWDGTQERGREFENWARDAALLSYAQLVPSGNEGEPWQLRLKIELPGGQGQEWVAVPKGAIVNFGGTHEEPKFSYRLPRAAARAFDA